MISIGLATRNRPERLAQWVAHIQQLEGVADVPILIGTAAAAIRSQVDLTKCSSLPDASMLTDFDVVKHVLFGSVPLPASGCSSVHAVLVTSHRFEDRVAVHCHHETLYSILRSHVVANSA
jgi:hypothetical protein